MSNPPTDSKGTVQRLSVTNREPVVIETPLGYITIEKIRNREFAITLPDGCKVSAKKGWDRASNQYVHRREDGKLVPLYKMLVPLVDESGALVGIEEPKVLKIARPLKEAAHVY